MLLYEKIALSRTSKEFMICARSNSYVQSPRARKIPLILEKYDMLHIPLNCAKENLMSEQEVSQAVSKQQQEQIVQAVYGYAAQMMREGHGNYKIEKALVEKGLNAQEARQVVRQLSDERNRQISAAQKDNAMKNMAIGGVICLIGLAISIGSYQAAASSPTGGSYTLAWGAVIFGGIQFFRGLSEYN
jgi:cation transport ATPase